MKTVILIQTALALAGAIVLARSAAAVDLQPYRWNNRLILIFAPAEKDSTYLAVRERIRELRDELDDRDIVLFHLFEDGESHVQDSPIRSGGADSLRRKYQIQPGALTLVLIGKDGGEKMRQRDRADFNAIFSRIDAMPMRQREMRQKKR
jgi:hypothetical protein